MYSAIAFTASAFPVFRKEPERGSRWFLLAAIGVCSPSPGCSSRAAPRPPLQQHPIDNGDKPRRFPVAIQMSAAPAHIRKQSRRRNNYHHHRNHRLQAELATARRKTPEKQPKPPSAKPAVNAVNKKRRNQNRSPQKPPRIPERIKPHSSSPADRQYPLDKFCHRRNR